MIKKIKGLVVFLIIIGLGFGTYYLAFETDIFRLKTINYNAHEAMDIFDLERYSGIHYGDLLFEVDIEKAKEALVTHPYVRSVIMTKQYPSTLNMEITYRKHFMNIKYSDIILSLDNSLQVLKVIDEEIDGYTVEGMPFNAFSTGNTIEVDAFYVLENIVQLIDLLNQTDLSVDSTIRYEDNNVSIYCGTIRIDFGDADHIASRFNKFVNIYEALAANEIKTGIIDVSSDGLPVYRPFGE